MLISNEVVVSTFDIPMAQRQQFWEKNIQRYLIDIDCLPTQDKRLEACLIHRDLSILKVNEIAANSHSVHRSCLGIKNDNRDSIFVCLMTTGSGYSYQGTASAQHAPGDMVIYDTALPYGHGFPDDMSMFVLDIPKSLFDNVNLTKGKLLKIEKSLTAGTSSTDTILKLLQKRAGTLKDEIIRGEEVIYHIQSLLTTYGGKKANSYLRALFKQCQEYIEDNLAESDLNSENLSLHFSVTIRQLSRAFEFHGVSINRYIWHRRLQKCREALISTPHLSITEIAFKWGFNHSAHFSRVYKQCFDETPKQTRSRFYLL